MQWSEAFLQKHPKQSIGNVSLGNTTLNATMSRRTQTLYNGVINVPHLGHLGLLSLHVQQDPYGLHMTFSGSYVQRGLARRGGGIWVGFVVQQ